MEHLGPRILMLGALKQFVGVEHSVANICHALHLWAAELHAPAVGAVHVTCSDESENECVNAFQRGFVQYLLPPLKFAQTSAFRIANLGGRYEWGAVRTAEQHYATAESQSGYKLMVVKLNSHTAIIEGADGNRFGTMKRYQEESTCCGALGAMLQGDGQPFAAELREMFASEGQDRVATLLDEHQVDPDCRSLYASVVSARMQARKVILEIQDHVPVSPTLYLVVHGVTINRPERDTEMIGGFYTADTRQMSVHVEYFGLGDDPAAFRIRHERSSFSLSDEHSGRVRLARDHRHLVRTRWHEHAGNDRIHIQDDRLRRIHRDVAAKKHKDHKHGKLMLRALLPILAEVSPVSAAVLLFAQGMAGIHHAFRVHRLATEMAGSDEARRVLADIQEKIDHLDPDRAEAMVELLLQHHHSTPGA